ncbi:MAG: dTMP kinase [Phycisphaerae bacterium]|jgi:dTMP kinase
MAEMMKKLAGKFLVIDGPDGAGKTTQINLLINHLAAGGLEVCKVRDPGGTAIGDKIRQILLDRQHEEMSVRCELMLYMASRAQLAHQVIRPALAAGRCVVGDRYISSTVAYQGAGGMDGREIQEAGRIAVGDTLPDLTVILNLPAETGLGRLKGAPDRMEAKAMEFHRRVRELFLQQAAQAPDRFAVVDAAGSVEEVQQRILAAIAKWIG